MIQILMLPLALFLLCHQVLLAGPNLTFFFRPYPSMTQTTGQLPSQSATVSGIFTTYAGQLSISNSVGQVEFARKHPASLFNILVCTTAKPILNVHNTVHHWEIDTKTPCALFSIERQYDADSKTHFWLTTKKAMPENRHIALETILVFAEPQDIYIPEGISVSDENQNLALPDIYVQKTINTTHNALYVLDLKNFLDPINLDYKKNGDRYATQLEE